MVVQTHRIPGIIHLRWCKQIIVVVVVVDMVDMEGEADLDADVVEGAAEEELMLSA